MSGHVQRVGLTKGVAGSTAKNSFGRRVWKNSLYYKWRGKGGEGGLLRRSNTKSKEKKAHYWGVNKSWRKGRGERNKVYRWSQSMRHRGLTLYNKKKGKRGGGTESRRQPIHLLWGKINDPEKGLVGKATENESWPRKEEEFGIRTARREPAEKGVYGSFKKG